MVWSCAVDTAHPQYHIVQAVKRKAGKPGRPRAIKRAATQDVLLSPASDPRCQVSLSFMGK